MAVSSLVAACGTPPPTSAILWESLVSTCRYPGCSEPKRPNKANKGRPTKYCWAHNSYLNNQVPPADPRICVLCTKGFRHRGGRTAMSICSSCLSARVRRARDRVRRHGGDIALLRRLLDPGSRCDLCGLQRQLEIDHDHRHCPGEQGCGKCIRGLLCGLCNTAIAHFEASLIGVPPERIVAYLGSDQS